MHYSLNMKFNKHRTAFGIKLWLQLKVIPYYLLSSRQIFQRHTTTITTEPVYLCTEIRNRKLNKWIMIYFGVCRIGEEGQGDKLKFSYRMRFSNSVNENEQRSKSSSSSNTGCCIDFAPENIPYHICAALLTAVWRMRQTIRKA